MPKNSGTSNTNAAPNYIFCQHFKPSEAHDGKRCDCFDIKQVYADKPAPSQSGNNSTDPPTTSQ